MDPNGEDGPNSKRRMSERIRMMVIQHLIKEGHSAPFTDEQLEQGKQSYVTKARALKGGDVTQELARLLEQCRSRHTVDSENQRSRYTFQILSVLAPLLDKKNLDLERVETHELMTGLNGREAEQEVHGLRFGAEVSRLVTKATRHFLVGLMISLKRIASRRLDDGEHWLPTSTLANHDPKFKLHHLAMQDSDLAKKRENQLRLLQTPTVEKTRKTEKDDQMKQHDADVQRVEEANRQRANQMFPSLEPSSSQVDAGGDDEFDRAAKQMKLMMMSKATKDTGYAPTKDTRYIDRKLCTEDLVSWLENDAHFRSSEVLLQSYLRLGAQRGAVAGGPAGKEILSPSKKRGPPT